MGVVLHAILCLVAVAQGGFLFGITWLIFLTYLKDDPRRKRHIVAVAGSYLIFVVLAIVRILFDVDSVEWWWLVGVGVAAAIGDYALIVVAVRARMERLQELSAIQDLTEYSHKRTHDLFNALQEVIGKLDLILILLSKQPPNSDTEN